MSKATLTIDGVEYEFGQKYQFSDDILRWITGKLRNYDMEGEETLPFKVFEIDKRKIEWFTHIKPLPTELDLLKEELTKLIAGSDTTENFKKKVRHLVNKESCVIPWGSISETYKSYGANCKPVRIIQTSDLQLNLPKNKAVQG
jgi:hypothetical protein